MKRPVIVHSCRGPKLNLDAEGWGGGSVSQSLFSFGQLYDGFWETLALQRLEREILPAGLRWFGDRWFVSGQLLTFLPSVALHAYFFFWFCERCLKGGVFWAFPHLIKRCIILTMNKVCFIKNSWSALEQPCLWCLLNVNWAENTRVQESPSSHVSHKLFFLCPSDKVAARLETQIIVTTRRWRNFFCRFFFFLGNMALLPI